MEHHKGKTEDWNPSFDGGICAHSTRQGGKMGKAKRLKTAK
jgi:hypothetical protein